eukprot:403356485
MQDHKEYLKSLQVDDIEIQNGEMIPSYFLMKKLEQRNLDKQFYFALGTDLIPTLRSWHEGDKLLSEINFVIFNRSGFDIENGDLKTDEKLKDHLPTNYIYNHQYKSILGMVSSTEVRNRIKKVREDMQNNQDQVDDLQQEFLNVAGLVTKGTLDYIKQNNLY